MMSDVRAIMWKEWRELSTQRTTRIGFFLIPIVFGVFMPATSSSDGTDGFDIFTWAFLPFILAMPIIADAFAGERERHTLETLLATRLTEVDILTGKIGSAALYGVAGAFVVNILRAITFSVKAGSLVAPPIATTVAGFALSCAVALFVSTAGALVSLRAKTVRQAQQVLSLGMAGILFSGLLVFSAPPLEPVQRALVRAFATTTLPTFCLGVAGVLFVGSGVLLGAARAAFRRDKLLLD